MQADVCVCIDVPDEVLVERMLGRRVHKQTGKTYHLKFDPPPPEIRPEDLEQRADDTEEKIKGRIASYKRTCPSPASTLCPVTPRKSLRSNTRD